MTGTKQHSGGKRTGQGRPKKPGDEYLIKIRCDEATFRAILANTTPEQRAEWLHGIATGEIITHSRNDWLNIMDGY